MHPTCQAVVTLPCEEHPSNAETVRFKILPNLYLHSPVLDYLGHPPVDMCPQLTSQAIRLGVVVQHAPNGVEVLLIICKGTGTAYDVSVMGV